MFNLSSILSTNQKKRLSVVIAVSLTTGVLLASLSHGKASRKTSLDPNGNLQRTPLEMIRLGTGIIGRDLVHLPHGDCIIVRPSIRFRSNSAQLTALSGSADTTDDDLELYLEEPDSRWYVAPDRLSESSTFNCAAYALGDLIGLSKSDWLEPSPVAWTNNQSPAQTVLDNYFSLVSKFPASEIDWEMLELAAEIQEGDVLTFAKSRGEGNHVHMGRIEKNGEANLLVSKLGDGPISRGRIVAVSRHFPGQFNEVRIYRHQAAASH